MVPSFAQLTMKVEFLLLIAAGFKKFQAEGMDDKPKMELNRILRYDVETCDDVRRVSDLSSNISLEEKNAIFNVFHNNDKFLAMQGVVLPKGFIFGNKTELLLNEVFKTMFQKLVDLSSKLDEVVQTLRRQKPFSYEYRLLSKLYEIYGTHNAKNRVVVKPKIGLQEVYKNGNRTRPVYSGYELVDYLSEKELRSHGTFLFCAFFTLANLTNDHNVIKESLQPLEMMIQDRKSSQAMLIFTNKFLAKALEANSDSADVCTNLFTNYIVNQLQKINTFNLSELSTLQDKSDLQAKNGFDMLEDPPSILMLIKEWRSKMEEAVGKSNKSVYFHLMDDTFRQALEKNNAGVSGASRRSLDVVSVNDGVRSSSRTSLDLVSTRRGLVGNIGRKIKFVALKGSHLLYALGADVQKVIESSNTSTSLLQFANEVLDQLRESKLNIMQAVYNYIIREASAIDDSLNKSVINAFREKKMEEMAAILDDYLVKAPTHIATMALDWLFDLKIQMLMHLKTGSNVFEILKNTYKNAKLRYEERKKRSSSKKRITQLTLSPIKLDKNDELMLQRAYDI